MKITKARLKEIIQEELLREHEGPDPEHPDFSVSGAEDLKRNIAQHQAGRPSHRQKVRELRDELNSAYGKLEIAQEKAALHGQTPEIMEVIDVLKGTIEELEYMLEFPD